MADQKLEVIEEIVKRIEQKVDHHTVLLEGSNGEGLVTKVALVKQSLNRAWWWLGSVSLFLLAVIGKWIVGK